MNELWNDWSSRLQFLQDIPDNLLRLHVGYLYFLGSSIELDYWRTQNFKQGISSGTELIEQYLELVGELPKEFHWSEPDPSRETFSIPFRVNGDLKFLNRDVLRTQVDVSNLYNYGVFQKVHHIIEIGGGYGHLAVAIKSLLPHIKYSIVDLSFASQIQRRWINYISSSNLTNRLRDIQLLSVEGGFIKKMTCDLLINVNSFCEMQESVVRNYISGDVVEFSHLYSNNRDVQFMNKDLQTKLLDIYGDYFDFKPSKEDYLNSDTTYKKQIILSHKKGEFFPFNPLNTHQIKGIKEFKNYLPLN